jgi:hypothetical protein
MLPTAGVDVKGRIALGKSSLENRHAADSALGTPADRR